MIDKTIVDMVAVVTGQETADGVTYPFTRVFRYEFEDYDSAIDALDKMARENDHVMSAASMQEVDG